MAELGREPPLMGGPYFGSVADAYEQVQAAFFEECAGRLLCVFCGQVATSHTFRANVESEGPATRFNIVEVEVRSLHNKARGTVCWQRPGDN